MAIDRIRRILLAGFSRFYDDGVVRWSRAQLHGAINPRGEIHDLESSEIQSILIDFEQKGLIRLLRKDDAYLEIMNIEGVRRLEEEF